MGGLASSFFCYLFRLWSGGGAHAQWMTRDWIQDTKNRYGARVSRRAGRVKNAGSPFYYGLKREIAR
jgi:hypothetical protein